jgi:hypothetical protein|tara:strand:- start:377 stop:637 length:261 start_codon:yes stop_codon:yes gene_type:complete
LQGPQQLPKHLQQPMQDLHLQQFEHWKHVSQHGPQQEKHMSPQHFGLQHSNLMQDTQEAQMFWLAERMRISKTGFPSMSLTTAVGT